MASVAAKQLPGGQQLVLPEHGDTAVSVHSGQELPALTELDGPDNNGNGKYSSKKYFLSQQANVPCPDSKGNNLYRLLISSRLLIQRYRIVSPQYLMLPLL